MPDLRRVGRESEDRAAEYLVSQGFTIVTRRAANRFGEIDLVALEDDVLVFVEVKQRLAEGYVPEEALGPGKAATLKRAAQRYLDEMGEPERAFRFDLIAIDRDGLRHHRDVL